MRAPRTHYILTKMVRASFLSLSIMIYCAWASAPWIWTYAAAVLPSPTSFTTDATVVAFYSLFIGAASSTFHILYCSARAVNDCLRSRRIRMRLSSNQSSSNACVPADAMALCECKYRLRFPRTIDSLCAHPALPFTVSMWGRIFNIFKWAAHEI